MSISRGCRAARSDARRRGPLAGGLLILLAVCGCSSGGMDAAMNSFVEKIFQANRTPQQYMILAVSSEDADVRRDAVVRVADSKRYDQEWAIKGFVAIALLENDPQTRCVAIRALDRTGDPRATESMLKILNYEDYPPQEVWPPVAIVRWDATEALADLSSRGAVPEELRGDVQQTFIRQLRMAMERNTRIAAARGLGYYEDDATIEALLDGLRDDDFAVVHECENALVRLTGRTHGGDVLAWERWYAEHMEHAFADSGHVPESRRPPYDNRWEKFSYETKDLIEWLWPGSEDR